MVRGKKGRNAKKRMRKQKQQRVFLGYPRIDKAHASQRWWGLVLDMVGLGVTEEGRMLCMEACCCCCNAPGSQMSWCGSDLRLSLGIEPPVAI